MSEEKKIAANTKSTRRTRARGNGEGSLFKRKKIDGRYTGPYYLSWFDEHGKRREFCAKTTDRAAAMQMLAKRIVEVAKRRDGIISPAEAMVTDAARTPIEEHITDYIDACKLAGNVEEVIKAKTKYLHQVIA